VGARQGVGKEPRPGGVLAVEPPTYLPGVPLHGFIDPPLLAAPAPYGPSLWLAPLDVPPRELRRLAACVPPGERTGVERLYRAVDRRRLLAARGWLRKLLGGLLGREPEAIAIVRAERQKPVLAQGDLHFSASYSAGFALFATSREMEVGVDLEAVRPAVGGDLNALASRFFAVDELDAISSLPARDRVAAAVQCWSCKEAYGKGRGVGLDYRLKDGATWSADGRPVRRSGWTVHQVAVAGRYVAALAGSGSSEWAPRAPHRLEIASTEEGLNDR
jgi:4'-phosphopantetheinyl transferase